MPLVWVKVKLTKNNLLRYDNVRAVGSKLQLLPDTQKPSSRRFAATATFSARLLRQLQLSGSEGPSQSPAEGSIARGRAHRAEETEFPSLYRVRFRLARLPSRRRPPIRGSFLPERPYQKVRTSWEPPECRRRDTTRSFGRASASR